MAENSKMAYPAPLYPIVANPAAMTIAVGPKIFDRPLLARVSELSTAIKDEICGEAPIHLDAKGRHAYYAERLGPKFNRRFQAANYWLWLGNVFHSRTANMLRRDGRRWKEYNEQLVWRAHVALTHVWQAENDNLFHLIPAIITFGESPQVIRQMIGQGAWRRVANNSLTRNRLIMQAVERVRGEEQRPDPALFLRLLDIPSGLLRWVWGATPDEVVAARICPRRSADMFEFLSTVHMVRDARAMIGLPFNPLWSYARIRQEHEAATKNVMRRKFDARRFTTDWTFESGGFSATLLTSQLDIASEGAVQHHCVGSYARHAASGQYAIFRIEGKERATAGLIVNQGRIDQIYGACNSAVSDACKSFAYLMAAEYLDAHPKRHAA